MMIATAKRRVRACQLALVVVMLITAHPALAGKKEARVFLSGGDYVVVNKSTYRVKSKGSVGSIMPPATAEGSFVAAIQWHPQADLILLMVGKRQEEGLSYVALKEADLGLIGTLADAAPTVADAQGKTFFMSDPLPLDYPTVPPTTRRYDAKNLKVLRSFRNRDFVVTADSCFVGKDRLYTNRRMISAETGQTLKNDRPAGKRTVPVDCKAARALFLGDAGVPKSEGGLHPILVVYDLQNERTVGEVKLDRRMTGYRSDEWFLAPDGVTAVRDVFAEEMVGAALTVSKPGVVHFTDVASGAQTEITLPVKDQTVSNRILGFSADGKKLFYGSSDTLFIIDLSTKGVVKSLQLDGRPVGVVW